MRGHPSSSCSAAACAILELLVTAQSTPHSRLEILDISGNGKPMSVHLSGGICMRLPRDWRYRRRDVAAHVLYGGVCSISLSREDDCWASFLLLFCFAFLFCFFVVDIVASHSFRRSRNGSIRIEISSAPTDAKGCAAAASALILARAMLVKKLANVDAG
jgi:hypothetical protein